MRGMLICNNSPSPSLSPENMAWYLQVLTKSYENMVCNLSILDLGSGLLIRNLMTCVDDHDIKHPIYEKFL